MNLVKALVKANNEARAFLRWLEEHKIKGLPGAGVEPARTATKHLIAQTEVAIASGDIVLMLEAAAAHGIGDAATPTEEA